MNSEMFKFLLSKTTWKNTFCNGTRLNCIYAIQSELLDFLCIRLTNYRQMKYCTAMCTDNWHNDARMNCECVMCTQCVWVCWGVNNKKRGLQHAWCDQIFEAEKHGNVCNNLSFKSCLKCSAINQLKYCFHLPSCAHREEISEAIWHQCILIWFNFKVCCLYEIIVKLT